jgi:hypothetical protein
MFIKPLGTSDLVRQVEALLIRQADRQQLQKRAAEAAQQHGKRSTG